MGVTAAGAGVYESHVAAGKAEDARNREAAKQAKLQAEAKREQDRNTEINNADAKRADVKKRRRVSRVGTAGGMMTGSETGLTPTTKTKLGD